VKEPSDGDVERFHDSLLGPEYLEIEIILSRPLDVKMFVSENLGMEERDHVDRFLETATELPIDLAVEGIVDRINGLARRIRRMNDETMAEHGISYQDFRALGSLWRARPDHRLSAGKLGERLELSSGSMTARLDSLEEAGLVRRLTDPADRRGVLVELTDGGREAYTRAVEAQAEKENLVASALTAREKEQLNALLRRLMLVFERREAASRSR